MRALFAVAAREVRDRRFVLLAAAAASVLPFLVPLVPGLPAGDGAQARSLAGAVLSASLGLAVAIAAGASAIGPELTQGRLGFYFSRPVSSLGIWGGKIAGGLFLALAATLVVLLPAAAAGGGLRATVWDLPHGLLTLAFLGVVAVTFLVANVVSVALRARSPWLAIDLVLCAVLPWAVWLSTRRMLRFGVIPDPGFVLGAAFGFLPAVLLLASAAQVSLGRTDARRGHGAQSLVLWLGLLCGALGYDLWSRWYVSPSPAALEWTAAAPAGGDRWALVEGSARGRRGLQAAFLVDLQGRRTIRVPAPSAWLLDVSVSSDGSRALFPQWDGIPGRSGLSLVALDLATGGTGARAELPIDSAPESILLSADGSRAAVYTAPTLQVMELPSGRILASFRLPASSGWRWDGAFVAGGVVRLWPRRPSWKASSPGAATPPIVELDVAARRVTETGRYAVPLEASALAVTAAADGSLVLVRALPLSGEAFLLDGRTGALVGRIGGPADGKPIQAAFLSDRRVVTAQTVADGMVVSLHGTDGSLVRSVELPGKGWKALLGSEILPGVVTIAAAPAPEGPGPARWNEGRLLLVDLGTGKVTEGPAGLRPAFSPNWWFWRSGTRPSAAGAPVSRLVSSGDRHLALLDPATLVATPLF